MVYERCPECRATNGNHFTSCSTVANTPRVQVGRLETQKYWGMLWIDKKDNSTNFKFNVEGGDFASARKALVRFIAVLQKRLDDEKKCPVYKAAIVVRP